MQTFRLTALALVLAAGCTKASEDAATAKDEKTGVTATESGADEEMAVEAAPTGATEGEEPAAETAEADGKGVVAEGEGGGEGADDPAARLAGPGDEDRKLVAIGANKTRIIPLGTKTVADNDQYTLKLKIPAGVAKDADGKVKVLLTPQKGWKLNREFPTKLTVEPPSGVEVAKKSQGVDDAVSWDEKKGATWAVGFSAGSSGKKDFTGKFKFAVCTEATCVPKGEELAFSVKVE